MNSCLTRVVSRSSKTQHHDSCSRHKRGGRPRRARLDLEPASRDRERTPTQTAGPPVESRLVERGTETYDRDPRRNTTDRLVPMYSTRVATCRLRYEERSVRAGTCQSLSRVPAHSVRPSRRPSPRLVLLLDPRSRLPAPQRGRHLPALQRGRHLRQHRAPRPGGRRRQRRLVGRGRSLSQGRTRGSAPSPASPASRRRGAGTRRGMVCGLRQRRPARCPRLAGRDACPRPRRRV